MIAPVFEEAMMAGLPQIREAGWFITDRETDPVRHLFIRLEERMDGTGSWTLELHRCRTRPGTPSAVKHEYGNEDDARAALTLIYALSRHLDGAADWQPATTETDAGAPAQSSRPSRSSSFGVSTKRGPRVRLSKLAGDHPLRHGRSPITAPASADSPRCRGLSRLYRARCARDRRRRKSDGAGHAAPGREPV